MGGTGGLYGVVQCIMGNDHMGSPLYRQMHMTENITFPQFRWCAVMAREFLSDNLPQKEAQLYYYILVV